MSVPVVAVECPQEAHDLHYTVFNWSINGLTMPPIGALMCLLGCIIMFLIALNEQLEGVLMPLAGTYKQIRMAFDR